MSFIIGNWQVDISEMGFNLIMIHQIKSVFSGEALILGPKYLECSGNELMSVLDKLEAGDIDSI